MARPVTLFTGQWADMPLEELAKKASKWGYDGLELICLGDHLDPDRAAEDTGYCEKQKGKTYNNGGVLSCLTILYTLNWK